MGMSTHIIGIKPPDEKWRKMKAIYDACIKGEVGIPQEVEDFFDGEPPDEKGVVIDLEEDQCCSAYSADMQDGFEIDAEKLPDDVKIIRFYNSY